MIAKLKAKMQLANYEINAIIKAINYFISSFPRLKNPIINSPKNQNKNYDFAT